MTPTIKEQIDAVYNAIHVMDHYDIPSEALEAALDTLQTLEESRWIPVNEKPDPIDKTKQDWLYPVFLAYLPHHGNKYKEVRWTGEHFVGDYMVIQDSSITHYMKLPSPPAI